MEGKITYQKFLDVYREANSDLKKDTQYKNGQARWNDLKGDEECLQRELLMLKAKSNKKKIRSLSAWAGYSASSKKAKVDQVSSKGKSTVTSNDEEKSSTSSELIQSTVIEVTEDESDESKTSGNVAKISEHEKPAQRRLEDEISKLKTQFYSLVALRETDLSSVDKKQNDEVKSAIFDKELKLKRLKSEAERQSKRRQKLQEGIETVTKNNTEAAALLKSFNRKATGRPRVEMDQPELLSDGSNAYTHAYDLCELFLSERIPTKDILLIETDGAQDEAPRYPAPPPPPPPDKSTTPAFNPVVRRMSPLSHDLAGIILPHDTFGSHLKGRLWMSISK